MNAKHTPGPWVVSDHGHLWNIHNCHGVNPGCTVQAHGDYDTAEQIANARLIAAAPELLEACKAILELSCEGASLNPTRVGRLRQQAQEAIAKAEQSSDQP